MTIKELLEKDYQITSLQKEKLLCYLLNCTKEDLFVNMYKHIDKKDIIDLYNIYIEKLKQNYPIQYITKSQFFYNYDFYVDERVLIPRQETEWIVDFVVNQNIFLYKKVNILEIGCGSGCISISISKCLQQKKFDFKIFCVDISKDALDVACLNYNRLKATNIEFFLSDLFTKIDHQKYYDIIIANLPYVKYLNENIKYEPHIALMGGGKDGLNTIKKFMSQLKNINFGLSVLEMDDDQTKIFFDIYKNDYNIEIYKDCFNLNRFAVLNKK